MEVVYCSEMLIMCYQNIQRHSLCIFNALKPLNLTHGKLIMNDGSDWV